MTGAGMTWLQLIPDACSHVITIKYFPDGTHDSERKNYPLTSNPKYQPSIWYVDIIEGIEYDEDGVAVFIDKYIDVIFTPEGDVKVDDRNELEDAYTSGDINKEQYEAALAEADLVLEKLTSDITKTEEWCAKIRQIAEDRIENGEPEHISREKKEKQIG